VAIDLLPVAKQRRDMIRRTAPVLGTVIVVGYCLLVIKSVFRDQPHVVPFALAMMLSALVAASWGPLRDVVTGVFLKVGRVCSLGDRLQVGDVSGRVVDVGYRTLTLETVSGEHVVIPYAVVARGAVSKVPVLSGAQPHVFELTLRSDLDVASSVREIQNLAMLSHWSSLVKVPRVKLQSGRVCRVTVYPLTFEHGPEIEETLCRKVAG